MEISAVEIFLIVIISGLTLALIFLIIFWYARKNYLNPNRGKVMFEIDNKKRLYRHIVYKWIGNNKIPNINHSVVLYSRKWKPIENFTKFFNKETIKKYREALHLLDTNKEKEVEFETVLKNIYSKHKNDNFEMKTTMNKSSSEFIHVMLSYNNNTKQSPIEQIPLFEASFFKKLKLSSTILLILNTKQSKNSQEEELIKLNKIKKIVKRNIYNRSYAFVYKDRLIFSIPTSNQNKINVQIKKWIKDIIKDIKNIGLESWCSSGGFISNIIPDTPKKIQTAIIRLEYLIYKSKKTKQFEYFVSEDLAKFKEFSKIYFEYEQASRAGNVEIEEIPVRHYNSRKLLVNYYKPKVKIEGDDDLIQKIGSINYLKVKMADSFTKKIIDTKPEQSLLLDVNSSWFIQNYSKLTNKKIVYTLDFKKIIDHKHIGASISQIQENGFLCAIKINLYNIEVSNLIDEAKPKFIIIDSILAQKIWEPKVSLKLTNLYQVAKERKIKLIYENPTRNIDSKQVEKIGLEFYYKKQ
ncbi:MAG: hypothetical protein GY679_05495 [Mycoplasma sp.]|nr:hypothetical protein [Mycoplasma sp.]